MVLGPFWPLWFWWARNDHFGNALRLGSRAARQHMIFQGASEIADARPSQFRGPSNRAMYSSSTSYHLVTDAPMNWHVNIRMVWFACLFWFSLMDVDLQSNMDSAVPRYKENNVITMKPRSMPTWHAFNQEGRTPIHGRWGMTPSNKQSGTPRRIRSWIAYETKRKDFHVSNKGMGGSPSYENTRTPKHYQYTKTPQPLPRANWWKSNII